MSSWIFVGIVCALSGTHCAQFDYDFMRRNSFSIARQSQNLADNTPENAFQIRTLQDVETYYGAGYVMQMVHGEMTDTDFTEYTYADVLTLQIPEEEDGYFGFTITGESYAISCFQHFRNRSALDYKPND